jgi:hypothetical protein
MADVQIALRVIYIYIYIFSSSYRSEDTFEKIDLDDSLQIDYISHRWTDDGDEEREELESVNLTKMNNQVR